MKTSKNLIKLVKHFESLHDGDLNVIGLQPKLCPAGIWTEGYGKLVLDDKGERIEGIENKEKAYTYSVIKNERDAEEFLKRDLEEYAVRVDSLKLNVSECQRDALISFAYNVGFNALKTSTLLRKIKEGKEEDIEFEFLRWNKARVNGELRVLPGLTRRRKSEAHLYIYGEVKYFN